MNWDQQTIAITGAASGLGRALALHFTAQGAKVLGLDRSERDLLEVAKSIPGKFEPLVCDVTDPATVELAFTDHQDVQVLINSAGITGTTNRKSYEVELEDVHRVFAVNFFGSLHTSRAVLPGMAKRGYGRVLHIASIAGKEGNAGMVAYSASKAAVIGMAKVQGKEMAGTGVTVNALAPAVIQTPMVEAMPATQVEYMTSRIPMGRLGTLDELVQIVAFAVSPACSFTTAFTFDLSGGRATY